MLHLQRLPCDLHVCNVLVTLAPLLLLGPFLVILVFLFLFLLDLSTTVI